LKLLFAFQVVSLMFAAGTNVLETHAHQESFDSIFDPHQKFVTSQQFARR